MTQFFDYLDTCDEMWRSLMGVFFLVVGIWIMNEIVEIMGHRRGPGKDE